MAESRRSHSFVSFTSRALLLFKAICILALGALCLPCATEEVPRPNPVRISLNRGTTKTVAVEFTSRVQRHCFEVSAQAGEHMTAKIEGLTNDSSTAAGFVISPSGKLTGMPGFFFNSKLSEAGIYSRRAQPLPGFVSGVVFA